MSIYKKGVNNIEDAKKTEYVMSNNSGIYMNTTVLGENTSPCHGLFIKQNENQAELFLSKVIEHVKIEGKNYYIKDIQTSEEKHGGKEYLEDFDRYPIPSYRYNIEDKVEITKKYFFSDDNVLLINYHIKNNTKSNVNVKILPAITNRNLYLAKRESMLKLNLDEIKDGIKIALSIIKKQYLYLKSSDAACIVKPHYLNGINYTLELNKEDTKTYIEDLYVPGYFEVDIKKENEQEVNILVSTEDIDISKSIYNKDTLLNNETEKYKMLTLGIDDSFFELKQLALSASELNYIDKANKKFVLLNKIPGSIENNSNLKAIIKSIEGNYILLRKYKEAYRILDSIKYRLIKEKNSLSKLDYYETLLMYVEALSKYINSDGCMAKEKIDLYMYIREVIVNILNLSNEDSILDDDFVITIDNKKYLKINIYWYNALKIYINLTQNEDKYAERIFNIAEKLKDNLIDIFFDDNERVLKYEATDTSYANIDMLLALDLTYPLVHDKIAMKIIDTAFKELYTPYGMRRFSVKSGRYDGYVYPHLMATFVNANLRQNGVTRATQKIAYNLVKELFSEINKKTIGTIKYMYDEKTKNAYGSAINSLTNSEIIRLYNMLT